MHTYVKVTPADDGAPAGKLADVELHFAGGELDGLRLIGFAVWARRDGGGKNVTFPARQFTVRGERRSYTLLRSIENVEAEKRLREFVLQAYAGYDNEPAATCAEVITVREQSCSGRRRLLGAVRVRSNIRTAADGGARR